MARLHGANTERAIMAAVQPVLAGHSNAAGDLDDDVYSPSVRQEKAFLDHVLRVSDSRGGRFAVLMHLSRLTSACQQPEQIRIAIGAFEDFVVSHDAQLFCLANNDIVVMVRGAPVEALERTITRLRYQFRDDPLSRAGEHDDKRLCTWLFLDRDYETLLALARRCNDAGEARKQQAGHRVRLAKPGTPQRQPLTPGQLDALEKAIARNDITAAIRTQPVCGMRKNLPPQPVFDERYVSIAALEEALMPQTSFAGDPWLFRRLTAALDGQMLRHVGALDVPERAISLNLTVKTVLSPEFDRLEALLVPRMAGKLVIELQASDFFLDSSAFAQARDTLRERGHTLCLDGATHRTLPFMDHHQLGVDLIKLHWSDDMPRLTRPDGDDCGAGQRLLDAVARIGPARLILCHCDGPVSIDVGQALGIALFQGRHIDYLLAMQKTVSQRANRLRHALVRRQENRDQGANGGSAGGNRPDAPRMQALPQQTSKSMAGANGRSGSLRFSGFGRADG